MKKRCAAILMVLIFTFVFAAGCGQTSATDDSSNDVRQSVQNTGVPDSKPDSGPESDLGTGIETKDTATEKKIAVVYFSATGTTAEAANLIAKVTGADIFEIVPEEQYTSEDLNYNDDNCRANKEMNDDTARPVIADDLSMVSEYDVIYLGYPIWWGTAPRIVQTFLESYDISQATVHTFCTSGGSGIEKSVEDLQDLYPDVNITDGKRFGAVSEEAVKDWIESIN